MTALRLSKMVLAVLALAICSGTAYAAASAVQLNGGNPVSMTVVPSYAASLTATVSINANGVVGAYTTSTTAGGGVVIAPPAGAVDSTPSFTVTLTSGYAATLAPSGNFQVTLTAPDGDATVQVNVTVVSTPLTALSPLYHITFVKGSTPTPGSATATVVAATGLGSVTGTQLDPGAMPPSWLTVTVPPTISSGAGSAVAMDTTPAASIINTWAPGHYTVSFRINSTDCAACVVTVQVDMLIQLATATTVSVKGVNAGGAQAAGPININWTSGNSVSAYVYSSSGFPAFSASCDTTSTNDKFVALTYTPTPCSLKLGSTTGNSVSGLASVSGTPITVTWDTNLLSTAPAYGARYNDTVTLNIHIAPQGGVAAVPDLVYTFTLLPPNPTISASGGISPSSTPGLNSGDQLVLTITGTGFVCGGCIKGGGQQTRVFVGPASPPTQLEPSTTVVQVTSPTTMKVTITGNNLPSAGSSTKFYIGLVNQPTATPPSSIPATIPSGVGSGTIANPAIGSISVSTAPAILGITNSASYAQPVAGAPKVSPLELVSIFGVNFAPQANPVTLATPNSSSVYANSLTITGTNVLQVKFSTSSTMANAIAAPILFATPNQINCIVPQSVTAGVPMYVTVSYGSTSAPSVSVPFQVSVVASDPGIFSLDATGGGPAAIINYPQGGGTPTVNGQGGSLAAAASGDVISIYATGLGAPNSVLSGAGYPAGCIATTDYNHAAGISAFDGAVVLAKNLNNHLPPCFLSTGAYVVTVSFNCTQGGGPATTTTTATSANAYAGFVADSVEGLDQINVTVPANLTSGACPITISNATAGNPASQIGVTVQIQ